MYMRKNKKVVLLSGGFSEEAEVSLVSAAEIGKTLTEMAYNVELTDPKQFSSYSEMINFIKSVDPFIVFNGLHGQEGEDGRIQSLFELEQIAYTGSGCRASAIAMDKHVSGILAEYEKVKVPKRIAISKIENIEINKIESEIGFPMVIKPNDSGSSVGISIVKNYRDITPAIKEAFQFSNKILIEEFIDGRELTVTVLDGKALPVVEIKPKDGWYDYANKYTTGNTVYEAPARLDGIIEKELKLKAEKIFKLFGCEVYARVDFRYDGKDIYFLEVNTLPGMTPLSLTPMAAKADGIDFEQLLKKIIELSMHRFHVSKGD
jgi:D-alanine-D-alanine ligase